MRRSLSLVCSLLILTGTPFAFSQTDSLPPELPTSARLPRVVVELTDGHLVSGWVTMIDERGLMLATPQDEVVIERRDVRQVRLLRKREEDLSWVGLLGGMYVGGILLMQNVYYNLDEIDGTFVKGQQGGVLGGFYLGLIAGGSVGMVLDQAIPTEPIIHELEDEDRSAPVSQIWEDLRKRLGRENFQPIRISIYGGHVFGRLSGQLTREYRDAGLENDPPTSSSGYVLLRRVECGYAPDDRFEAGLLLASVGEVPVSTRFTSRNHPQGLVEILDVVQGYGWGAYLRYHPLAILSPDGVDLSAGLGGGVAATSFLRFYNPSEYSDRFPSMGQSAVAPFLVGSLDLRLRLTHRVSLGLGGDYLLAGSLDVPSDTLTGKRGMSIPVRNGSVGLLLGFRF